MNSYKEIIKLSKEKITPFYWYDGNLLNNTLKSLINEIPSHFHVHYALKANSHKNILKTIQKFGLGADCVSGNEIVHALNHNFSPNDIFFAGVGKTDKEIETGISNNIGCFNCESIEELKVINEISKRNNTTAPIAIRINPNINPNTHAYITTGLNENKFGINLDQLNNITTIIQSLNNIELTGFHIHIGSQIQDLNVFKKLAVRANEIYNWFSNQNIPINHINLGGGLGVDYQNSEQNIVDFNRFFSVYKHNLFLPKEIKIHFELGRSIVAHIGKLVTKVVYIKNGTHKRFAIVDAGMTELLRPSLYESFHRISNISNLDQCSENYEVVGPICESSDFLGKNIQLPPTKRGDILVVHTTGAYGESMASQYNMRDLVKGYYSE